MRILIAITAVIISGCATTKPAGNSDYSDLYSGRSQIAFATELPSGSASAAIRLGDQAYREGKLDQALFHYLQSVNIDDLKPHAFHRIGLVHRQRGDFQLAGQAFQHVLERDPQHLAALEELGFIMLQQHRPDAAIPYFERVLEIDQTQIRSHNGLGVIADLNGQHSEAVGHFREALKLQPASMHIMNNLGYSQYLAGDWEVAEQTFQQVLAIDKKHELAVRNLALLYTRRGQTGSALSLLGRVGNLAAANNDLGYLCMLDGQHELADNFFQKAIELSPTYYELAYNNRIRNSHLAKTAPDRRFARLFAQDTSQGDERRRGEALESDRRATFASTQQERYREAEAVALDKLPSIVESEPLTATEPVQQFLAVADQPPLVVKSEQLPATKPVQPSLVVADQPPVIVDTGVVSDIVEQPTAVAETKNASTPIPASDNNQSLYLKRYVQADILNVRAESSESGSILDRISRDRVVRVLRKSGEWAYVVYWRHLDNGVVPQKGWVHASFLSETTQSGLS